MLFLVIFLYTTHCVCDELINKDLKTVIAKHEDEVIDVVEKWDETDPRQKHYLLSLLQVFHKLYMNLHMNHDNQIFQSNIKNIAMIKQISKSIGFYLKS